MNNNIGRSTQKMLMLYALSVALISFAAGCSSGGGGRDPILGSGGATLIVSPTITATAPANGATGVPINDLNVVIAFSEPMNTISSTAGNASLVLTCNAPCVSPTGTVALNATGNIATYTVTSAAALAPSTQYTATVTAPTSVATGLPVVAPYVWQFTTGTSASSVRPGVTFTVPATTSSGPTPGVPANTAINAIFSKDMLPATLSASSFTVTCTAPCVSPVGAVSYDIASRSAIFTPTAALTVGATYTATVTTAATNLEGNALGGNQASLPAASNYIWTFIAAAASPVGAVSVKSTNPLQGANMVCTNASVNATFNVPSGMRMNPNTIDSATFKLTGPAAMPVIASSVALDAASGQIATLTPASALTAGVLYTATIKSGASGVADESVPANTMMTDYTWTFTAQSCSAQSVGPTLGSISTYGTFGGSAGMTNMGIKTVINGDIGTTAASTLVTGFHDSGVGCTYTEVINTNVGTVNGLIYTAAPPPTVGCPSEGTAVTASIAAQARLDALNAYNQLVAMPAGPGPGNLAGLTLAPGDYTAASGSFMIQGGDLTLDAQGDANAVWVFQMATTLLVGGPGAAAPQSVLLVNGAQAKNVFWQVGSAATINAAGGGTMVGTIISQDGVTFSTSGNVNIVTLNGRAISLGASVTMVDTVINVPQ